MKAFSQIMIYTFLVCVLLLTGQHLLTRKACCQSYSYPDRSMGHYSAKSTELAPSWLLSTTAEWRRCDGLERLVQTNSNEHSWPLDCFSFHQQSCQRSWSFLDFRLEGPVPRREGQIDYVHDGTYSVDPECFKAEPQGLDVTSEIQHFELR